ncbi:MAG: PH domain-containing protein [Spirosomataceae bacterium]
MNEVFYSSRVKDPLIQDEVHLTDKGVNFKIKKLFGGTENFVFYQDIAGVELDKGLFFASIRLKARAREHEILIENFSRSDAERIKQLILERV